MPKLRIVGLDGEVTERDLLPEEINTNPEPLDRPSAELYARTVRGRVLDALAGELLDAMAQGDTVLKTQLMEARQGMRDVMALPAMVDATTQPGFMGAFQARMATIRDALPPVVGQRAFRDAGL